MNLELTDKQTNVWLGYIKSQMLVLSKIEDELKKSNFPPLTWYDILWELEKSEKGSLRLNDLGKKVLLNKYNVTRLIDRMEKEDLVSRESCPVDGRGIFACITEKGRKLRKNMWNVYYKAIKDNFISKFNQNDLNKITEITNKLTD